MGLFIDVAVPQLCNHGTCVDITSDLGIHYHNCICNSGYTGGHCETQIDECASRPCYNGATCRNHVGGYSCQCDTGYQGTRCEWEVDECANNPCQNGGVCHDLIGRFQCSCPHGTRGMLCEEANNNCVYSSCNNGGTCVNGIGTYSCLCLPGFTGLRCEGDINECDSSPCSGIVGAIGCVQLVDDYRCECDSQYTGRLCDKRRDRCKNSPCRNGGVCEDLLGVSALCHCLTVSNLTNRVDHILNFAKHHLVICISKMYVRIASVLANVTCTIFPYYFTIILSP